MNEMVTTFLKHTGKEIGLFAISILGGLYYILYDTTMNMKPLRFGGWKNAILLKGLAKPNQPKDSETWDPGRM